MKWVTRENANVDRIACPWLIKKFIDHLKIQLETPMYDALYAWCKER